MRAIVNGELDLVGTTLAHHGTHALVYLEVCPTKAVYRLLCIAHRGQRREPLVAYLAHDANLQVISILKLIDHDGIEAVAI